MHKKWLLFALLLASCAEGPQTLGKAAMATVVAANTAYKLTVETCDEREKRILARPPTTEAADRAAIEDVRATCDQLFSVFETARTLVPLVKNLEAVK